VTAQPRRILTIDLGTGGPKAAVVDSEGTIVSVGQASVETLLLPDGGAEQDAEAVWASVLDACRQALAGAAGTKGLIGVSICSQYSSIVPVDETGRPTMNMVIWLDKRGAKSALRKLPGGDCIRDDPLKLLRWLRIHGIPPLETGLDSLAHMRWIMLARPDVYERTYKFLEPMDYVAMRFTGRAATNPCSAFLMLLVDNRDLRRACYNSRLVGWSCLDEAKLPEVVPVDTELGPVLPEVARELGLPGGVTVHAPVNDTQAGGMGCYAFGGSHAGISIGTSSVMVAHVPFKRTDIRHAMVSMPSPVPGTYFVMAENGIGGRAVEHFLEKIVFATDAYADHSLDDKFAALHEAVARTEPGSGGVLFLPWLSGSLAPAEDRRVRGGFLNMSLETTREHLGRAVLEGIALNFRWLRGPMEKFVKRSISHLVFYGGGAKSDLWAQIIADVVQLPVHQLAEPDFVTCRGMALLGFQRHGLLGFDDFKGLVPVAAVREPRTKYADRYGLLAEQFVQAYRANRRIFRALNR
jgi:xylulokinase